MKVRGPLGRNIKIVIFYCQRIRKSEDQAQRLAIRETAPEKVELQVWYAKVKALFGKDWDSETMGWEYRDWCTQNVWIYRFPWILRAWKSGLLLPVKCLKMRQKLLPCKIAHSPLRICPLFLLTIMPIIRVKSHNNLTGDMLGLLRERKGYTQKKLQDPAT